MKLNKYRKIKTIDLSHWRDKTDLWGEPTMMFMELLDDDEELKIGDRVTIDLRVLVERRE